MTTKQKAVSTASMEPDGLASLIEQYGCGPVEFAGTDEALYERHLLFDNVVKLTAVGPARTLRGSCPLRPGRPLATLVAHRGHL